MKGILHSLTNKHTYSPLSQWHHLQQTKISPCQMLALSKWKFVHWKVDGCVCISVYVCLFYFDQWCLSHPLPPTLSSIFVKLLMLSCSLHYWLPLAHLGRRSPWCSVFLAHPEDHWGLEVVCLRPVKTIRAPVQSSRDRDGSLACSLQGKAPFQGITLSEPERREPVWAVESQGISCL